MTYTILFTWQNLWVQELWLFFSLSRWLNPCNSQHGLCSLFSIFLHFWDSSRLVSHNQVYFLLSLLLIFNHVYNVVYSEIKSITNILLSYSYFAYICVYRVCIWMYRCVWYLYVYIWNRNVKFWVFGFLVWVKFSGIFHEIILSSTNRSISSSSSFLSLFLPSLEILQLCWLRFKKEILNHPYHVPSLWEQTQQEGLLSLCYDVYKIFMHDP